MIHARDDYQRIQDPAGVIPPDEPVFLLRAQDETAWRAVEQWAWLQPPGSPAGVSAMRQAERMKEWGREHATKVADVPSTADTMQGQPNPAEAMADRFQRLSERIATEAQLAGRPLRFHTAEGMRWLLVETCAAILRGDS